MKIKANIQPGTNALITGGSSGIGLALAENLVKRGCNVYLVARRKELLEQRIMELKAYVQSVNQKIEGIQADVADWQQVQSIADQLITADVIPDLIINSAGVVQPGYVHELSIEQFHWMMDINYHGTVHAIKAFMPEMMRKRSGYIINISSGAGYFGVFGYTGYSGSKFAVRGFTDVLRWEMKPYNIGVAIVYPSDTETPQLEYDNKYKPPETKVISENAGTMTAEAVARDIIEAAIRGKKVVVPGFVNKLLYFLSIHFGGKVLEWLADFTLSRAANGKK